MVAQGPLMVGTDRIAWGVGVVRALGIVAREPLYGLVLYDLVRLAEECFGGWLFRPAEEDARRVGGIRQLGVSAVCGGLGAQKRYARQCALRFDQ